MEDVEMGQVKAGRNFTIYLVREMREMKISGIQKEKRDARVVINKALKYSVTSKLLDFADIVLVHNEFLITGAIKTISACIELTQSVLIFFCKSHFSHPPSQHR